jgi:hypothetical protein
MLCFYGGALNTLKYWLVLLLLALAFLPSCKRESARQEESHNYPGYEAYYLIKISDKNLGHSLTRFEPIKENGRTVYKTTLDTEMSIIRMQLRLDVKYKHTIYEDANLLPLRFELEYSMSNATVNAKGFVRGDSVIVEEESSGSKTRKAVFIGKDKTLPLYFQTPFQKVFYNAKPKPGTILKFKTFMPIMNNITTDEAKIEGIDIIKVMGKDVEAYRLEGKIPMLSDAGTTKMWLDSKGKILSSTTEMAGMTIRMDEVSKEQALAEIGAELDLNIYVKAAGIAIETPRQATSVRLRLSVPDDDVRKYLTDDDRQKITSGKDKSVVELQIKSDLTKPANVDLAKPEPKLEDALKPTVFIQSDDPEIKAKAMEIVGKEHDRWKAALLLSNWVFKNLGSNYKTGFATAKEVYKSLEGDCTEHSVLHIALCRSIGIPARGVSGLMYSDGRFAYHMWSEVYVDGWRAIDSTWPPIDKRQFVDATHIKLATSYLGDSMPVDMGQKLIGLIGKLKIEVLEYK